MLNAKLVGNTKFNTVSEARAEATKGKDKETEGTNRKEEKRGKKERER